MRNIDFSWLNELANKTNSLQINSFGANKDTIHNLELMINSKLPESFKIFLNHFNGVQNFDGITILSDVEIKQEIDDEIILQFSSPKITPFAKYKYEYSYLVFDENGQVFVCEHDNDRLRYKYPDFLGFILLYSFHYVTNFGVYEDMDLPDIEIENRSTYFENLILQKLHSFGFEFDTDFTPNWTKWNIEI